jgi:hypothetical protein
MSATMRSEHMKALSGKGNVRQRAGRVAMVVGTAMLHACVAAGLWLMPVAAGAQSGDDHHAEGAIHVQAHVEKSSLQDLSRQANNPVSTMWTLQNQFDINTISDVPKGGGGQADDKVSFAWNFQPVLPLHLTKEYNFISRAVLPFVESVPVPDPSGGTQHKTGFGDIVMANVVAPNKSKGFMWAIGPTWRFPSASSDFTGSGKWSAGPAAAAFWVGEEWIFGVFPQQWFSFAGDGDREDVSLLDLQYFVWRLFPGGWQVGFGQDIIANWKADGPNQWTVPIGIGVGKTFQLGGHHFKLDGQISYAVAHPDEGGQRAGFKIRFSPIIGALCCTDTLF